MDGSCSCIIITIIIIIIIETTALVFIEPSLVLLGSLSMY